MRGHRSNSTLPRVLLLVGVVALASISPVHALFGLRGSSSQPTAAAGSQTATLDTSAPAASPDTAVGADASPKPGPGTIPSGPQKAPDPADPYPFPPALEDLQDYEAWEDEKGELHIIRADRLPSGDFVFPEGTTVPKDPRSMARIVSVMNALGEHFQCLVPALKKPLNPAWLDVPQVPVVEAVDSRRAEAALESLEGKCFYRVAGIWTYEMCYKSHVKQMRIDPNGRGVLDEILLGVYNASTPYELLTAPDRLDHTQYLDEEGPAWTTSIMTAYTGGDGADQAGNGWLSLKGTYNPFSRGFGAIEVSSVRPRVVGLKFKCLKIQEEGYKQWLDSSNVYLDQDHVPFDMHVLETALGVYEITIRTEKLCEHDLLYQESTLELSQFGNLEDEVVCHSEDTGKVYKLKDVPNDDRFWHKFKEAVNPWWND